jgi:hypothetical protein
MDNQSSMQQGIVDENGMKHFIQKSTVPASAAVVSISQVVTGATWDLTKGATLMLQSDVDFWYQLLPTGGTTTVTVMSGSRPGTKITAGQQEYVNVPPGYDVLDRIADSSTGSVVIHLVKS